MSVLVSRIKKFVNRPIGYGTVLSILVGTLLMTGLFWKSQSPELQKYSDLMAALSELKYFDARVDRHIEAATHFGALDTASLMVDISVLREVGRSVSDLLLEMQSENYPLVDTLSGSFEQNLSLRLNRVPRVIYSRIQTRMKLDSLIQNWTLQQAQAPSGTQRQLILARLDTLYALRRVDPSMLNYQVQPNRVGSPEILALYEDCLRQIQQLKELNRPRLQVQADDMIQQSRRQLQNVISSKSLIHQGFYLLSLLFILIVLVLVVRVSR